jgi:hypothetical protein
VHALGDQRFDQCVACGTCGHAGVSLEAASMRLAGLALCEACQWQELIAPSSRLEWAEVQTRL